MENLQKNHMHYNRADIGSGTFHCLFILFILLYLLSNAAQRAKL